MFVVFEGIDGSGKTTVSNLVAKALRERGIEIDHIREGGEFASPLVGRMREFGKDTRNVALRPLPEFLMYVARDAQLLAECINPALAKGGLVFADRYLYSYEVLGHYGRGLEVEQVRPIIDSVAGGVWPELVVLMDVDPHLARARRRVSKLRKKVKSASGEAEKSAGGGGSRKGLGGVGMMHRLREGYLRLAEREPNRWIVIDNSNSELDLVVERVTEAIMSLYEGASTARVVAGTNVSARASTSAEAPTVEAASEAFYDMISLRREKEPGVAAYFLAGLLDPEAHSWRTELLEIAPHIVAHGLKGLGDNDSWDLREALAPVAPFYVTKSISGQAVEGDRADAMRKELFAVEPVAVLGTVGGLDSVSAWAFRESLVDREPRAVVASLGRMQSERAWDWRDKYIEGVGGDVAYDDMTLARPLLASIRGLGDQRSWVIRERCQVESPIQVLKSIDGLDCERSWKLRKEFAALAPKVVLRTFDMQDHEQAWSMRKRFASKAKEALDSMSGLDVDAAWAIREALADVWPSTVAKSLGALAGTERGLALLEKLLEHNPTNLSLLKHATQVAAASATGAVARRSEGHAS
jgi:dTMP kinase